MSTTPGDLGIPLANVPARRGWYGLEDRHAGMTRAGAGVIAAIAIIAAVAPIDELSGRDRALAVLACVAAIAVHVLLLWIPRRHPRRLLAAVDVGLVADAVLIGVLAQLSGGTDSLALWLLPIFCLAATLALAPGQGVKALILSALVVGAVALAEGDDLPGLTTTLGPLALAVAVVVVAGGLAALNERELVQQRARMDTLYDASVEFVAADDGEAMTRIAEDAARALLPGWHVTVTLEEGEARQERGGREDGRAFLELPLVARRRDDGGERSLGTITASRPVPEGGRQTVRGDSVKALRTLSQALSAALVQQELRVSLEHMSMSDPLTGLGNRRAFDEALAVEAARAQRAGGSMGVVILDVDHFKQFNDQHGHQAGDDALMSVARVLAQEARGVDDRACRIGGEEFALLLPGADDRVAAVVAERVRRAIESSRAAAASITVSLGVAASDGDDPRQLLATADARLYVAKAAGRNRVISR